MKKGIKILLCIMIVNWILITGLIIWLSASAIAPSLKDAGISFKDLFSEDTDNAKLIKFNESLFNRSSDLGAAAAEKIISGLNFLFRPGDSSYEDVPKAEYPYPSVDEILERSNAAARSGAAEGLKILDNFNK